MKKGYPSSTLSTGGPRSKPERGSEASEGQPVLSPKPYKFASKPKRGFPFWTPKTPLQTRVLLLRSKIAGEFRFESTYPGGRRGDNEGPFIWRVLLFPCHVLFGGAGGGGWRGEFPFFQDAKTGTLQKDAPSRFGNLGRSCRRPFSRASTSVPITAAW